MTHREDIHREENEIQHIWRFLAVDKLFLAAGQRFTMANSIHRGATRWDQPPYTLISTTV